MATNETPPRQRRHRRKTIAEIVGQKAEIKVTGVVPPDWVPDRDSRMYEARMRAWKQECPKCGAPAFQSCRGVREGVLRWAFHKARWKITRG